MFLFKGYFYAANVKETGLYYKYVFGLELAQNAIFSYISVSTVFSLISLAVKRLRYWLFFFQSHPTRIK